MCALICSVNTVHEINWWLIINESHQHLLLWTNFPFIHTMYCDMENYWYQLQWSVSCFLWFVHTVIEQEIDALTNDHLYIMVYIGLDKGLAPVRCQAIISTNVDLLTIRPLETKCGEISVNIQTFSFKKMQQKMLSVSCQPFCSVPNILTHWPLGDVAVIWS